MPTKLKDNYYLSYFIAFFFILSLFYFIGYLYGLGISPVYIPLAIADILNGTVTYLPIVLVIFVFVYLIGLPNLKIPDKNLENQGNNKNSELKKRSKYTKCIFYKVIGQRAIYIIFLFLVITLMAFLGTNLLSFLVCAILFVKIINLTNITYIGEIYNKIIKSIIILLISVFCAGFTIGYYNFYLTNQPHLITLKTEKIYKGNILANLSKGLLLKRGKEIIFINNTYIKSIKYKPSISYIEEMRKKKKAH